jgi:O-antigen ligase
MRHLWLALFVTTSFLFIVIPRTAKKLLLKFFAKNVALIILLAVFISFIVVVFPQSTTSYRLQDVTDPVYSRARSLARSTADSSARWRFFAWNAARESILEAPVFGVGFGKELIIEFETYRVIVPMRELHNSLLVLLVQMGIVGLSIFLYILLLLFIDVYRSWKSRGIFFPYHAAFFSALLVFLSASFTQPYFETNFTGIFFWILMGLLIVSLRLGDDKHLRKLIKMK